MALFNNLIYGVDHLKMLIIIVSQIIVYTFQKSGKFSYDITIVPSLIHSSIYN